MKRKLLIPLMLAAGCIGVASPAGGQPPDDPLAAAKAGGDIPVDEARAAYFQAEEKVATLSAVGLSTTPKESDSSADEQQNADTERVPVLSDIPLAGRLFRNDSALRKTLRPVVVESFIARQRLQRAQVNELRRRLAEIEQSLAEREKRMDAIVDARVDDLLSGRTGQAVTRVHSRIGGVVARVGVSQVEEDVVIGNKSLRRHRPISIGDKVKAGDVLVEIESREDGDNKKSRTMMVLAPIDGIIMERDVNVGDVVKPNDTLFQISSAIAGNTAARTVVRPNATEAPARSPDDFDIETRERIAEVDLKAAEDEYVAAGHELKRAQAAFETGTLTQSALAALQKDVRRAKAQLDRAKVKAEGLARQRSEEQARPRTLASSPSRDKSEVGDQFDFETRERLAQADLEEAQAVCDAAQYDYKAHVEANKKAPGSTPVAQLKSLEAKVRIAEAQLQRAKVKLGGLKTQCTELEAAADAAVAEAEAQRQKAAAKVATCQADYEATKALISEREADVEGVTAAYDYRQKVYERLKKLVEERGVEQKLADESEQNLAAAKASLAAAKAAVVTAMANARRSKSAVDEAQAALHITHAQLSAAKARRDRLLHRDRKDDPPAEVPADGQSKPESSFYQEKKL